MILFSAIPSISAHVRQCRRIVSRFRARKFQEGMIKRGATEVTLAILVKQRIKANAIARMDLVGDVEGQDVIIVDDMVDTAGTLCEGAAMLKARGARVGYGAMGVRLGMNSVPHFVLFG